MKNKKEKKKRLTNQPKDVVFTLMVNHVWEKSPSFSEKSKKRVAWLKKTKSYVAGATT